MSGVLLEKYVPMTDVLVLLPTPCEDKLSFVELPVCSLPVGNTDSCGLSLDIFA
jgi:hypothetical protein